MLNGLIGKKRGMTQDFDEEGRVLPLTIIEAGPVTVLQIKSKEKEGAEGIKVAFGKGKGKYNKKPTLGETKKAGLEGAPAKIWEVPGGQEGLKVGEKISVAQVFEEGEKVNITGFSKGRGFSGVMKRHSFHGGPTTHGQSDRQRAPGSIGQRSTPGRVYRGQKMAGHFGNEKVTVKNLEIFKIDAEKNYLYVKGAVPGAINGWVKIIKSQKSKIKS
ncbi:50S ribosomal protein L3 [Candidatus Shapirobacteria bacterium]|nr:50S ribosomal protein L3 [Candidatus Shapirobacteria bacterium]